MLAVGAPIGGGVTGCGVPVSLCGHARAPSVLGVSELNDRKRSFLDLAEVYVAKPARREDTARQMAALRLGRCSDLIPQDVSDRLAVAGSGGAFCGFEDSEGAFTYAEAARLIVRWHS